MEEDFEGLWQTRLFSSLNYPTKGSRAAKPRRKVVQELVLSRPAVAGSLLNAYAAYTKPPASLLHVHCHPRPRRSAPPRRLPLKSQERH